MRLLELRYSPFFVALYHEGMHYKDIHHAVMRGLARAQTTYPSLLVGLIGILDRMQTPAEAETAFLFFLEHRSDFLALDLANDENRYPAAPFAPLFARAKAEGLRITVHAGETLLPGGPANVMEAVEVLGAERVGHGIMAVRDEVRPPLSSSLPSHPL